MHTKTIPTTTTTKKNFTFPTEQTFNWAQQAHFCFCCCFSFVRSNVLLCFGLQFVASTKELLSLAMCRRMNRTKEGRAKKRNKRTSGRKREKLFINHYFLISVASNWVDHCTIVVVVVSIASSTFGLFESCRAVSCRGRQWQRQRPNRNNKWAINSIDELIPAKRKTGAGFLFFFSFFLCLFSTRKQEKKKIQKKQQSIEWNFSHFLRLAYSSNH